jgi:diacylglycerol kinase (ATP)
MRAAAILGLGCSPRNLEPFKKESNATWALGLPSSARDADAIVLFGGDGTIHRHLPALVKLALPVLIVPAGSGNDFARALQLQKVRDSLRAWKEFENGGDNTWTIDLGTIKETDTSGSERLHYFCCVAGCGLDGAVASRANALPRWLRAHGGYLLSIPPALRSYQPARMKISSAALHNAMQLHSDRPTLVVACANAPAYGDGMKIAPRALLDDGLLDICSIAAIGNFKLFRLLPTVFFGKHLGIREVDYFQSARVQIEPDRPLDVYADGEYVCQTPVEVGIQPSALRVIVP